MANCNFRDNGIGTANGRVALIPKNTADTTPAPDEHDNHEECWGAHPGPSGPVDCDGREI